MSNSKHYKKSCKTNRDIPGGNKINGMGIYDNRQMYIKKKCKKCGKTFITKKIGGFENCRKCNNKQEKIS